MALNIGIRNNIGWKRLRKIGAAWHTVVTQLLAAFRFRVAGGSDNSSLPERKGRAILQKVYGKTVKFNQFVDTTTTSVTLVSGNKYYTMINGTASVVTGDGSSVAVTGGTDMVIDLTAAEIDNLTTPEEVEAWLALNVGQQDYYPYDGGSLISFTGSAVKSVGWNKWDEQAISGTLNSANGTVITPYTNRIVSTNYIKVLPNTKYSTNKKKECLICFYDKDYNTLQYVKVNSADAGVAGMAADAYPSSNTFVTPANCAYIKFSAINYSLPYANDLCINLSDPAKDGTYAPYWEDEADLSFISTLRDSNNNLLFPDGKMRKAGSVKDEASSSGGSKKLIEVDLGDAGYYWIYYSSAGIMVSKTQITSNTLNNLICSKYITWENAITDMPDGSISNRPYRGSGNIVIKDSSLSASSIVNNKIPSLEGVKLIYQLRDPITAVEHDNPMLYKVDKYSTEEVIVPDSADGSPTSTNIVADIEYQAK